MHYRHSSCFLDNSSGGKLSGICIHFASYSPGDQASHFKTNTKVNRPAFHSSSASTAPASSANPLTMGGDFQCFCRGCCPLPALPRSGQRVRLGIIDRKCRIILSAVHCPSIGFAKSQFAFFFLTSFSGTLEDTYTSLGNRNLVP